MKKCKYCQSDIDPKAKICPNCKKKQGMPKWAIILIVIVVIGVLGSALGGSGSEANEKNPTSTAEALTLLDGHSGYVDSKYSYKITGTIKNNKDKEYSYVQVEFYTYDNAGNLLDTCLANNSGLGANETWKFEASCFFGNGNASDVASYKLKEITKW